MAPNITEPRETSPLLPKPNASTPATDEDSSTAPNPLTEDGGDIERQTSNGTASKHQGLPEVRARMKYIFPAIAIGVRALQLPLPYLTTIS
jgi:hypothetical protein